MPNLPVGRRENFVSRQYDVRRKKVNPFYFHTFLNGHFMSHVNDMISLFFPVFLVATQSPEKYTFADIIFGNEQVCK